MRPGGAVNPLSILLVAAIMGAIYWAVIFGPLYLDNLGVKEAATIGLTAARGNEDAIRAAVLRKINFGPEPPGWHWEETDDGTMVQKPGLNLPDDAVTVEKNEQTNHVRISIDYARTVTLKPGTSQKSVSFHVEKEGPITQ